jgi:N-acetylglucosamine kinase-like BadF-type ATPase
MKYVLLAESGSTKTEWRLLADVHIVSAMRGSGLNPGTMPITAINEILRTELLPWLHTYMPPDAELKIQFYGAACIGAKPVAQMTQSIVQLTHCQQVSIAHDLLAAAHATAGNKPGLIVILGTGSNTALYDGTKIVQTAGGNGYLLGDEGGGVYLGKKLIKAALDNTLPNELKDGLEDFLGEDIYSFRHRIYQTFPPTQLLSKLTYFLTAHQSHTYITTLIENAFDSFIRLTLNNYPADVQFYDVFAVGSVAAIFNTIFDTALIKHQFKPAVIVRSPIDGLVAYYLHQSAI